MSTNPIQRAIPLEIMEKYSLLLSSILNFQPTTNANTSEVQTLDEKQEISQKTFHPKTIYNKWTTMVNTFIRETIQNDVTCTALEISYSDLYQYCVSTIFNTINTAIHSVLAIILQVSDKKQIDYYKNAVKRYFDILIYIDCENLLKCAEQLLFIKDNMATNQYLIFALKRSTEYLYVKYYSRERSIFYTLPMKNDINNGHFSHCLNKLQDMCRKVTYNIITQPFSVNNIETYLDLNRFESLGCNKDSIHIFHLKYPTKVPILNNTIYHQNTTFHFSYFVENNKKIILDCYIIGGEPLVTFNWAERLTEMKQFFSEDDLVILNLDFVQVEPSTVHDMHQLIHSLEHESQPTDVSILFVKTSKLGFGCQFKKVFKQTKRNKRKFDELAVNRSPSSDTEVLIDNDEHTTEEKQPRLENNEDSEV